MFRWLFQCDSRDPIPTRDKSGTILKEGKQIGFDKWIRILVQFTFFVISSREFRFWSCRVFLWSDSEMSFNFHAEIAETFNLQNQQRIVILFQYHLENYLFGLPELTRNVLLAGVFALQSAFIFTWIDFGSSSNQLLCIGSWNRGKLLINQLIIT